MVIGDSSVVIAVFVDSSVSEILVFCQYAGQINSIQNVHKMIGCLQRFNPTW